MKTENVAESHHTDIPYTFPAGHETKPARLEVQCYFHNVTSENILGGRVLFRMQQILIAEVV